MSLFSNLLDEASYYSEIADFDKFAFDEHVSNFRQYVKEGKLSEKQLKLFIHYCEGLLV